MVSFAGGPDRDAAARNHPRESLRLMSILTKVLLVFVVLAIPPVIYFAAGALSNTESWQKRVATLTAERDSELQAVELLKNGDRAAQMNPLRPPLAPKGTPGIAQLRAARDTLVVGRSRMWYGTIPPASIRDAEGTLMLAVDTGPLPPSSPPGKKREEVRNHGVKESMKLYVFSNAPTDQTDPSKRWKSIINPSTHKYLGEFIVTGFAVPAGETPDNNFLPVKPSKTLTTDDWEAIRLGGTDIVFYDAMPSDERDAFVGLEPGEIRRLLLPPPSAGPPSKEVELSVEQYVADGKNIDDFPILKNDPVLGKLTEPGPDPKTGARVNLFRRPLSRYDILFNDVTERIADLKNKAAAEQKELDFAKNAVTNFMGIEAKQTTRKTSLETELQLLEQEKMQAEKHLAVLEAKVAELTRELKTQLATNKKLTDEIAGRKTAALPPEDATAAAR
jgi:hypothetical protein